MRQPIAQPSPSWPRTWGPRTACKLCCARLSSPESWLSISRRTLMIYNGWYQVAFERDLTADVTPANIGTHPLALVRTETGVRAVDGVCPHRGAHLGYGGKL